MESKGARIVSNGTKSVPIASQWSQQDEPQIGSKEECGNIGFNRWDPEDQYMGNQVCGYLGNAKLGGNKMPGCNGKCKDRIYGS